MKVIVPQLITDDEIVSTNADDAPTAWSDTTEYDAEDLVSTSSGAIHWEAVYGTISGSACASGLTHEATNVTAAYKSTNTFEATGVAIGTAAAHRTVIVTFAFSYLEGAVTSMTIGGVSATIAATTVTGDPGQFTCGIAYAVVPTGTTATITIGASTYSTNSSRINVFSLYNVTGLTDKADGAMRDTSTDTVTPDADDYIIAVSLRDRDGDDSFTIDDTTESSYNIYTGLLGESFVTTTLTGTATDSTAKDIEIDGGLATAYNSYAVAVFSTESMDQLNLARTPGTDKTSDNACYPAATLDKDWWVTIFSDESGGIPNELRMFSQKLGETTRVSTSIIVEIMPPTAGNALAFFNVDAASIQVQFYNSSGTKTYDSTQTLAYTTAIYSQHPRRDKAVFDDLPDYDPDDYTSYTGDGPVKVTITNTGDVASCGAMIFGECVELGGALFGTEVGINDYSRKEFDTFGRPTVIEREYSDNADYMIAVQTSQIGQIKRFLASLRATHAVYIGDPDTEESVVYGYFQDLTFPIEEQSQSVALLEVDGLV